MLEAIFSKEKGGKTVASKQQQLKANSVAPKPSSSSTQRSTIKKIVRKTGSAGESIPSISAALNGKIETSDVKNEQKGDQKVSQVIKYGATPFTFEQAMQLWKEFSERYKEDVTHYNLLQIKPTLDGNIFKVNVSNYVMEEKLRHLKPELIGFLSKSLKNSEIEIEICIVKEKVKSTAITDDQKLKKMMSDNPAFMQMKNMFNLDFDG